MVSRAQAVAVAERSAVEDGDEEAVRVRAFHLGDRLAGGVDQRHRLGLWREVAHQKRLPCTTVHAEDGERIAVTAGDDGLGRLGR